MKRGLVLLAGATALLAACGSKGSGGNSPACKETADHALSVITSAPRDHTLPPQVQAYMDEASKLGASVMETRCVADHWSDAAITCLQAASNQSDLKACDRHLTATQRDAIKRDSQDAMRKLDKPKL